MITEIPKAGTRRHSREKMDHIALKTGNSVFLSTLEEDSAMVELMAPYKAELSSYVNTPIGTLINSDLNGTDKIKGISEITVDLVMNVRNATRNLRKI